MDESASLKITGVPFAKRRYVINLLRVGLVVFGIVTIFFLVVLPNDPEKLVLIGLFVVLLGILIIFSEFFAHEERRDSSTVFIANGRIILKNDYLDIVKGRRSNIGFEGIDHIDVVFAPSENGNLIAFMIIYDIFGNMIGTGKKDADGLKTAIHVLRYQGVKINIAG